MSRYFRNTFDLLASFAPLVVLLIFALIFYLAVRQVFGQDAPNNHPPQDQAIHEKFYLRWERPSQAGPGLRAGTCCGKNDCYPTMFHRKDNRWYAERREDGAWIPVPEWLLEHNRNDPIDSPDGHGHICMQPGTTSNPVVYCAVLGSDI